MYHHPPHLVRRPHTDERRFGPADGAKRAFWRLAGLLFTCGIVACGSDGTGLPQEQLRIHLFDGDGQVALAGSPLAAALRVQVANTVTGAPVAGASVRWTLSVGNGASLSPSSSTTDAEGVAQTSLILGSEAGPYRVIASTEGAPGLVSFGATGIEALAVNGLSTGSAAAGSTIQLDGVGFDITAPATVDFSGIPGTVLSASATSLVVAVPACLPARQTLIRVRQSGQVSDPLPLNVTASGEAVTLNVGEDLLFADTDLLRCRRVAFAQDAEYLVAVRSDDVRGGLVHDYSIRGLGTLGEVGSSPRVRLAPSPADDVVARWHDRVRQWERDVGSGTPTLANAGVSDHVHVGPPSLGEVARFSVLNNQGGVDSVQAVARYVSDRVALFEDLSAPASGLLPEDFAELAEEFDHPIHDVVTSVFGPPSDLDGNDRVIVLFTPAVNRLTPRGSDGVIGGFFFPGDLASAGGVGPRGEVFYVLVPDPTGEFGDPVERARVMANVPAVLAHEFQHMVHFNTRLLTGGLPQVEALWLSEALAQMAEDLVFEHHAREGNTQRSGEYRAGNLDRARRYLRDPGGVSLTVGSGPGTLSERGAGWLFARYLTDHFGGSRVLTEITQGPYLGVENVVSATDEPWTRTFSDWTIAMALDGLDVGPARFSYPSVSLRTLFGGAQAAVVEGGLSAQTFERSGKIHSASARYHSIETTSSGELAVTLTGSGVMSPSPAAALRMRIVRLR